MPFICLMQAQEKDLLGSLRTLLVDDLYAVIPELNPNHRHSRSSRSAKKFHRPKRKKPVKMVDKVKRGLGAVIMSVIPGLITLAMESLSSWIKRKDSLTQRLEMSCNSIGMTFSCMANTVLRV